MCARMSRKISQASRPGDYGDLTYPYTYDASKVEADLDRWRRVSKQIVFAHAERQAEDM